MILPIILRLPSLIIRRGLEMNRILLPHVRLHLLLELLAGSELQTGHQLVLVVGDQEEVLRPTLLQVVALGRHATQHAARAVHEREPVAVETHLVRGHDDRLFRSVQLRVRNAQNRLVEIACR